jgi:hypothetical protein
VTATPSIDLTDYEWLTGREAAAVLVDVVADVRPLPQQTARLRKTLSATRTSLVLEQVELRHRARQKFSAAERMFFTRTALEQATDQWIAAYKAQRFGSDEVWDLCCGIGGDLLALATRGPAIGIDRDPLTCHFATANLIACNLALPLQKGRVHCEPVTPNSLPAGALWHIDPDRRATGQRTTQLEFASPSREDLEALLTRAPNAALKLAPAATLPEEWAERAEAEWISRGGECKQLVAWFGNLAQNAGVRCATKLAINPDNETSADSFTGAADISLNIAPLIGRLIFEPDAAVLAAHLTGALATHHQLHGLHRGIAYLTADASVVEPLLASFTVRDVLPFDKKKIIAYLRQHGLTAQEIKVRGVEVTPERLRNELPRAGDPVTLIITPHGERKVAIVADRTQAH